MKQMKGKKAKWLILSVAVLFIVMLVFAAVGVASTLPNSLEWDGHGTDSLKCDMEGEGEEGQRPPEGWMHWVAGGATGVTDAELVLGGSGEDKYEPANKDDLPSGSVQFFTPYFDIFNEDGIRILTATFKYAGSAPANFVLSDYCPGTDTPVEFLTVNKTAVTSFTREHFWDIDKEVETEKGYELDDVAKIWLYIDGSGDETATWAVDVTYEGFEDSDFNVSGEITIMNTGTLDAVITAVEDVLGGEVIDVDFGKVEFPYTLEVGETLTGTYDEDVDEKIEGKNEVTVYTEVNTDDGYFADADIEWGDPDVETNETVTIVDDSDLFYEVVTLGSVTADNDAQFTYTYDFAYEDYDECGSFQYDNTATIVETGQSASATLKVNVQCYLYDTAYAKGDDAICFIPTFRNWGWTNPILPGEYEWDLWAGAAQCDTDKGELVGSVEVEYDEDGYLTVTFNVDDEYDLKETHVYAGEDKFPQQQRGRRTVDTVAPGQYYNDSPFDGSEVYVIAHAVVGLPDPDFGP